MVPRAFLFAAPAFALFSVVWSVAPNETMKYALELVITVIAGLLLASARSQEAVLRGMAAAFLVYVLNAVALGGSVAVGVGAGGTAFSGLTDSKNLLGDITSTGLILSVAVGMMAVRRRNLLWILICAAAVVIDFYVVLASRSAGALLGLGLGLVPLLVLAPLLAAGKAVRAWLTVVLAAALVTAALNYRLIATTMIEMGATMFDKDPTLTGRTYLWYRAADLIREMPTLGRGYYAFWLQGNVDAEGLWQYAGIQSRSGFTFHNTAVELLVTLGWVGLAVFFLVFLVGAIALVRKFVIQPSLALVFWISILLYEITRMPIESVGIAPFYFSTVIVFAALAAGFGRVRPPKAVRPPYRQAQIVQVLPLDYAEKAWANPRLVPVRGSLRLLRNEPEGER
jgi:exopolysaccharide production protein ExoQ